MFILFKKITLYIAEKIEMRRIAKLRKETIKQCTVYINQHCLNYERDVSVIENAITEKIKTIKVNHTIMSMNTANGFYNDDYIDKKIVAPAAYDVYQNLSYFQQILLSSYYFNGHDSTINHILFRLKTELIPFFVELNVKKR